MSKTKENLERIRERVLGLNEKLGAVRSGALDYRTHEGKEFSRVLRARNTLQWVLNLDWGEE